MYVKCKEGEKNILKQERMQIRKLQLQQLTAAGTPSPEMPYKFSFFQTISKHVLLLAGLKIGKAHATCQ